MENFNLGFRSQVERNLTKIDGLGSEMKEITKGEREAYFSFWNQGSFFFPRESRVPPLDVPSRLTLRW